MMNNAVLEILKTRRSCRAFTDELVDDTTSMPLSKPAVMHPVPWENSPVRSWLSTTPN